MATTAFPIHIPPEISADSPLDWVNIDIRFDAGLSEDELENLVWLLDDTVFRKLHIGFFSMWGPGTIQGSFLDYGSVPEFQMGVDVFVNALKPYSQHVTAISFEISGYGKEQMALEEKAG